MGAETTKYISRSNAINKIIKCIIRVSNEDLEEILNETVMRDSRHTHEDTLTDFKVVSNYNEGEDDL